jgi:hypothetical protein
MKNRFVVDYESYYNLKEDVSASTLGNANYVQQSYAYLVSVVGPGLQWVGEAGVALAKFGDSFWTDPQNEFWAANSNFDEAWTRKMWRVPEMAPWKCVLDRGAVNQYPHHLAGLTKQLLGKPVDKTLRDYMNGRHWADVDPGKQQELRDYCLGDSIEEMKVLERLPEPSTVEDAVAAHTRLINRRGVRIDVDRLDSDRERLMQYRHRSFLAIPWHNDEKPLSPAALGAWAKKHGLTVPASLAKTDEWCADLLKKQPLLAQVVGSMRAFRKANSLLAKIESVQSRLSPENDLPLDLIYCGARHTRRWSSRGVNVQNLERLPYDLGDGTSVWPREWIIPRPGKIFVVLDYAQVEPRCLNWLVGNTALLDMIRAGFGIYEAYARVAGLWSDPAPLKKANPALYKNVKDQVLGLGYGMGPGKYQDTARLEGISMTLPEAAKTVYGWRALNPGVVKLWGTFDRLIEAAVLDSSHVLEVEMPTGDVLRHFSCRATNEPYIDPETGRTKVIHGTESLTTRGDRSHTSLQPRLWGGTLTENVVQRMARDVLAEAILRLEGAGLPVVFHAHDEVILEVDIDNKEEAKAEAERLMAVEPVWAPGLPLEVEGDLAERYTKQ